jgi:hypothetical protein
MENSLYTLHFCQVILRQSHRVGPVPSPEISMVKCSACSNVIQSDAINPFEQCTSLGFIVEKIQSDRTGFRKGSRLNAQIEYVHACCRCYLAQRQQRDQRDQIKPCAFCSLGKKAAELKASQLNAELAMADAKSTEDKLLAASIKGREEISAMIPTRSTVPDVAAPVPQSLKVRGVVSCQCCPVQIEYKSKDPGKCSSLGFFDDGVDLSRKDSKSARSSQGSQSLGKNPAQRQTLNYRRMCCLCFNDRTVRSDIEPLRAKQVDVCPQCATRPSTSLS